MTDPTERIEDEHQPAPNPRTMTTSEKRALVRRLRRRARPMSYRDIGRILNVSAVYARRLDVVGASHPHADATELPPRRYHCRRCDGRFTSRAKNGPERCKRCGSYDWNEEEERR